MESNIINSNIFIEKYNNLSGASDKNKATCFTYKMNPRIEQIDGELKIGQSFWWIFGFASGV